MIHHFFHHVPEWIRHHEQWAWLITFFISFFESLAIIGLFIPGSTLLAIIGLLVGVGSLSLLPVLITAILGAIAGDLLSYGVGYRYHTQIRQLRLFKRYQVLFDKGELFFAKYGGLSVFVGRFLGPLRPTMPFISGMMNLTPRRFLIANISSAFIWALCYILGGVLVGAGLLHISPHRAEELIAKGSVALILFGFIYWILRMLAIRLYARLSAFFQKQWDSGLSHSVKSFLRDAQEPQAHRQLSLTYGALLCFILLILLFVLVRLQWGLAWINIPLNQSMMAIQSPVLFYLMLAVSNIGGEKAVLLPVGLLLVFYLGWNKQWRLALHFMGLLIAALIFITLLKDLSGSLRPEAMFTGSRLATHDYSFPSGHVVLAMIFWGFLLFICRENSAPRKRNLIDGAACLIVTLVAFSRLYLGLHWFSDVLGGFLLGLGCLLTAIVSYRRFERETVNIKKLMLFALAFTLILGIFIAAYSLTGIHFTTLAHTNSETITLR